MDSSNPYNPCSSFINLLNSPQENHSPESFSPTIQFGSSGVPLFSTQCTDDPTLVQHKSQERRESRRKWTTTEDVVLISAWLNTSKDAVVGNEQKAAAFWKRIAAYFACSPQVAGLQKREATHCKQRWQKINDLVCKFVGCYEHATSLRSSGQSEDDVIKVAYQFFANDYNLKFTLEHAWRELRNDQKWCASSASKGDGSSKRRKVDDGCAQSSNSNTVNHEQAMARPPGVKASKGKGEKSSIQTTNGDLEEYKEMWAIKEKDHAMKEKLYKMGYLDSLLVRTEPLSEIEIALKNKLITEML